VLARELVNERRADRAGRAEHDDLHEPASAIRRAK
jgi:hypothetical protein